MGAVIYKEGTFLNGIVQRNRVNKIHISRNSGGRRGGGGGGERERERERDESTYHRELAHVIVEASGSKICKVGSQVGYPGIR